MYPMNTGYIESLTIESHLNHVIKKTTVCMQTTKRTDLRVRTV